MEANVTARFLHAAPIATPARFCSAIKHSDERSGKASKNLSENVEFLVSPSKAQTRSLASPSFFNAVPYAKQMLKEPIDAREKQLESSSSKIILVQNSMRFYFLRNNLDDSSLGYEILFRIAGVRINFSLICWEKTNKKIKSD